MNGELEQSALAADAGFYSNRTYNVTYQGGVGVHFSILDMNHARCRLAIEESQALGVALQRDIKSKTPKESETNCVEWWTSSVWWGRTAVRSPWHLWRGSDESKWNGAPAWSSLQSLCPPWWQSWRRHAVIQHVPLDDGASIIEHGDVVVRVKRSFKDSVRNSHAIVTYTEVASVVISISADGMLQVKT